MIGTKTKTFFRYTAGRFLFKETSQMACRDVKFDMNELVHIAASSIASSSWVALRKLPEGQYSKAFLLTMDDGKRVIAKIPYPNAGRPHYTTASEVATMDFVSTFSCYSKLMNFWRHAEIGNPRRKPLQPSLASVFDSSTRIHNKASPWSYFLHS